MTPVDDTLHAVLLELPPAPVGGRLLGRLTLTPADEPGRLTVSLSLSGSAGTLTAEGKVEVRARRGDTAVSVMLTGVVDGRLATLSPRLRESIGRATVRRLLTALTRTPTHATHVTERQAWPAIPSIWPALWIGGGIAALLIWRRRR